MIKNIFIILTGFLMGVVGGYMLPIGKPIRPIENNLPILTKLNSKKEVLSFLPYWLLDKAQTDYSASITNLDYFGLTIDKDGTILRSTSPVELEPGYYALTSGKSDKLNSILQTAKSKNLKLSLTVFSGDEDTIASIISNPITNADNLINDTAPIMSQYGFTELNLDIESSKIASPEAQINYQKFVHEVRNQISLKNFSFILSMDIIPVDFIRNDHLAIPSNLVRDLDKIIIMAYDFHSPSSFVTGPVAPLAGAGTIAEIDTKVALDSALNSISSQKILLGMPLYGYSWETIDNFERAAVIPTTALPISSKTVEDLLASCGTCSAQFDPVAKESYVIYKNHDTNTFQQIFYPNEQGIQAKIDFLKENNLGGAALWALGYEASDILNPIQNFISNK